MTMCVATPRHHRAATDPVRSPTFAQAYSRRGVAETSACRSPPTRRSRGSSRPGTASGAPSGQRIPGDPWHVERTSTETGLPRGDEAPIADLVRRTGSRDTARGLQAEQLDRAITSAPVARAMPGGTHQSLRVPRMQPAGGRLRGPARRRRERRTVRRGTAPARARTASTAPFRRSNHQRRRAGVDVSAGARRVV